VNHSNRVHVFISKFAFTTLIAMDRATEKRVIIRAKRGDAEAFEELYNAFRLELYRSALLIMRHPADAEDAVSEAFIKTFRSIDRFDTKYPMRPWIHRILRNECNNIFKKRRAGTVRMDSFSSDWKDAVVDKRAKDSAQIIIESEEDMRVVKLLEKLSYPHREVIVYHYFNSLDLIQIADILDIPVGTVKSRLYHARKQLAKAIEGDEKITKSTGTK
jgi:RNA polymerase sigma-70 factor, ECF subfamily